MCPKEQQAAVGCEIDGNGLRQGLQVHVVSRYLVPGLARFLHVARTDGQIALQVVTLIVGHQQDGPVHAESLAGGDGGQSDRQHLLKVHRALQYRTELR